RARAMPTLLLVLSCAETCLLGVLVIRAVQVANRHSELSNEKIALIFYAALAACLIRPFWVEDQAFLRITTEIFFLGSSALLFDRTRVQLTLYVFWMIATALTFGWRVEW